MPGKDRVRAPTYDLLLEYARGNSRARGDVITDRSHISVSPSWALAVVRLGRPLSFSRRTMKSIGRVVEGAFTHKGKPLIITDDCTQLSISNSKRGYTKSLQATLRNSGTNYLSRDVMLPGDWVLAWCWNNLEDQARIIKAIESGSPANQFADGLKFMGRVHSVRKRVDVSPDGRRSSSYSMQAIGFEELDTQFFYDTALATASQVQSNIRVFMAQLGLDFSRLAEQQQQKAGRIKDNVEILIPELINIILGKGVADRVNEPAERAAKAQAKLNPTVAKQTHSADLKPAPQANKEAPFAYLVPVSVATIMGREVTEKSKQGVFGYADLLETLIGVQKFEAGGTPDADNASTGFSPILNLDNKRSSAVRKFTTVQLKGTFLPVNPTFVNKSLWSLLQQFLNPAINEMYTAMRANDNGSVVPTLVVRQIPFSTESIVENPDFPLTRFLSLPRWKVDPTMVSALDVGRSNATRINMVHVYGEAVAYKSNNSITNQMVRNPPIFDQVDIQRSGIKAMMKTVNCAIHDQTRKDGSRIWMEAIADWTFGSQYSLNGQMQCIGIQSPIAEGDNIEFEEMAYHIESVNHNCSIDEQGRKAFRTTLELSNGMPVDQSEATPDFPRYPGFKNAETTRFSLSPSPETDNFGDGGSSSSEDVEITSTETFGDPDALISQDPGHSKD